MEDIFLRLEWSQETKKTRTAFYPKPVRPRRLAMVQLVTLNPLIKQNKTQGRRDGKWQSKTYISNIGKLYSSYINTAFFWLFFLSSAIKCPKTKNIEKSFDCVLGLHNFCQLLTWESKSTEEWFSFHQSFALKKQFYVLHTVHTYITVKFFAFSIQHRSLRAKMSSVFT